ncbi:MAG: HlyC/CorC family transporter [Desulfobulbaceae bacterium]|nr:HlyC/CorC family transporter [Desulfobulbaceae bacterium]
MAPESSPATGGDPSIFRRFLELLGLARSIDSTEELDQEIQELIDDGEEQGLISHQEGRMIHSILEFRGTVAREIMTPSAEMITVAAATPYNELLDLCNDHGFSRIPIYEDLPDNIIGILYAKELLRYVNSPAKPCARDLAKPAYFALENQRIIHLLRDFQAKKVHLAIISDEFGSVRGLASLEDVLEEIVGEINDESDQPETGWMVVNEQTLVTDAKINLDEVEEFFHTTLPNGPYESVGGLVIHQLGHLPTVKEVVQIGPLSFQVLAATQRRIIKVKISSVPQS